TGVSPGIAAGGPRQDQSQSAGRSSSTSRFASGAASPNTASASGSTAAPGLPGTDAQIAGASAGADGGQVGIQLHKPSGSHRDGTAVVVGALFAVALAGVALAARASSIRRRRLGRERALSE